MQFISPHSDIDVGTVKLYYVVISSTDIVIIDIRISVCASVLTSSTGDTDAIIPVSSVPVDDVVVYDMPTFTTANELYAKRIADSWRLVYGIMSNNSPVRVFNMKPTPVTSRVRFP